MTSPGLQRISEGHAIRYAFDKVEPLRAELRGFVQSVLDDTTVPCPARRSGGRTRDRARPHRVGCDGRPVQPDLWCR